MNAWLLTKVPLLGLEFEYLSVLWEPWEWLSLQLHGILWWALWSLINLVMHSLVFIQRLKATSIQISEALLSLPKLDSLSPKFSDTTMLCLDSLCLHVVFAPTRACVYVFSAYKGNSPIWLGPTRKTDHLLKDLTSKYGHILRYQGLGLNIWICGGTQLSP